MQLLNITSTPMKYELQIEPARLEMSNPYLIPKFSAQSEPLELKIQSKNIKVKLDSYESRKSLGIMSVGDAITANAENSTEKFQRYVRNVVEIGDEIAKKEDDRTISEVVQQKMFEQPQLYTMFLPSGGVEISWEPNSVNFSFTPSETDYEWEEPKTEFTYIPGSIRLEILEFAKVEIEYMGEPIYIPKSSDPNYEPPQE